MLVKERYFQFKNQPKGEIGIEIELEGENLFLKGLGGLWNITHDGSLRGAENSELVLKQPILRSNIRQVLGHLDRHFTEENTIIKPSVRTGVHIHVNVQEMTIEQVFIFQLIWLLFEIPMVNYCGEDRAGNLFCLRSSDAEIIIEKLQEAVVSNDLRVLYTDELRYSAMNPKALCEYGSLEFRCLKTPKKMLDISKWINLLLKIKDFSLTVDNPQDLLYRISVEGPDAIAEEVFGELINYLDVQDWSKVVYESLRRVQPIIYSRDWALPDLSETLIFQVELPLDLSEAKEKGALTAREVVEWNA